MIIFMTFYSVILELGSQRVGEQNAIIDNVCQCILVVSRL